MKYRFLIWILWPSFLVAGVAEGFLFTLMDPQDIVLFGERIEASAEAVYTVGFFVLWALCALSSGLTYFVLPAQQEEDDLT
jgi:hypothetical protein